MNDQMTRQSLIVRLSDSRDIEAWELFIELYSPFVYTYLRRRGIQDADAADIGQEVLRTVSRSVVAFDHRRRPGSFRKWLITITQSRLADFAARGKKQVAGSGDTTTLEAIHQHPDHNNDEEVLERDYQECLFNWAADRIRGEFQPSTWNAFWQSYVEGQDCRQVAEELAMSLGAVYVARSRVLARLKEKIRQIEDNP